MKRRDFITISVPALLGGGAAAQPDEKPQKPLLAFGVVADPQYADVPAQGSRHYRESIKKLSHAIDAFNKHELKFMVTLGDVIDRDIESFPPMMALYKKSKAPVEFVLGNHD
ncbi:MAG: metallophosphoesterase, partial [Akkermansiaceae bacterium]